jgi:glycerol-3-phosphate dehydrogenase
MQYDFCVIGAGIIGAAVAAELRDVGNVCILERNERPCLETSGNNSGVIHPGFNHPPHTLKARLSVEGNSLLYEYCGRNNISHRRAGTYVLAFYDQEVAALELLKSNASQLGVKLYEQLPPNEYPDLKAALFAPSGGVVGVPELCDSLLAQSSASVRYGFKVEELSWNEMKWTINSNINASFLINAAGIDSDVIANLAGENRWKIYPCAGEYYEIQNWVSPHLFYRALHDGPGLGIHLTPTLRGTTWIGPTADFVDSKKDSQRLHSESKFREAAERLYPGSTQHPIRIAHRGLRPKLSSTTYMDFAIYRSENSAIHLVGIDSPGLTSCLAIARHVKGLF